MTILEDFIAAKIASGNMAQNVTLTSPDGLDIVFYVDPNGFVGGDVPRLVFAYVNDEGVVQVIGGIQVPLDTELNAVATQAGIGVEFLWDKLQKFEVAV